MIKTNCAGGVVLNSEGKVLIVDQAGTSWSLPKGHVKKNEEFLDTAKREIYEESGVTDIKLIKKLGSYERDSLNDSDELKTIHIFLFKTNQIDLKPIDTNTREARWVEKNKVVEFLTHQKDKEFFESEKKELE